MATLQPFKEGHHPEQYRVPSLDGKDRCKYTRQIFVQKGQRVKIGEPVKVGFFRQVAPGATLMYEDILYACDEDVCPEYTKDPRKSICRISDCSNASLLTSKQLGIKEVVTLTSDLSRKNLEKDFERMDTPQGTFYRMFTSPLDKTEAIPTLLSFLFLFLFSFFPPCAENPVSGRCLLRHPPRTRRLRIQRRTRLPRRNHGPLHGPFPIDHKTYEPHPRRLFFESEPITARKRMILDSVERISQRKGKIRRSVQLPRQPVNESQIQYSHEI